MANVWYHGGLFNSVLAISKTATDT